MEINATDTDWQVLIGNCMMRLVEQPDGKFKACVTSVPYHMLRAYSNLPGEIGRRFGSGSGG